MAPAALRLQKGIPVVFVSDVQVAADYYRDKLGFAIDFLHGHPVFYAAVSRDDAVHSSSLCASTSVRCRPSRCSPWTVASVTRRRVATSSSTNRFSAYGDPPPLRLRRDKDNERVV